MEWVKRFLKDEEGATAVEYGLMVAAIAAVIITVVLSMGDETNKAMTKIDTGLKTANAKP